MIITILIVGAILAGVVLYAHHKHLSAIAEVKGIVTSLRNFPAPSASPAAPKVEQP